MATTPGDQFIIRGNADNNKRLLLGYDTTNNRASLQSYTAASTAGPLLLNPSGGNVGIGSATAPSVALDVTGAIKASGDITAANISAGQLSSSGRVLTDAIDFSTVAPRAGGLWRGGYAGALTNTSAAVGEMVLMGSPKLHLATANGGAAVMTLSGSNVGIGKAAPSVALDVTGAVKASTTLTAGTTVEAGTTITAGGKSVPTSDENNLKIVRGTVNHNGIIIEGSGFTVTKGGQGIYDINFTTPFSTKPSTTASMDTDLGTVASALTQASSTQLVKIRSYITSGTQTYAKDGGFSFIAIGPR
jgi:hypothetical protein